jgi:glycosyltransferase involved in cell wall biosynthesis
MKIGLVNSTKTWGGGERWFLEAGLALAGRGHGVLLLTAPVSDLASRAYAAGLHVTTDPMLDVDVCVLNNRQDLARVLRARRDSPPFPLVLRRGIDRPLHDHVFRRGQWRRISAVIVNSAATRVTVLKSLPWFPLDRIRLIPNSVALDPAPRVLSSDGVFRIGAAGRLVRQKGFDILLDALALLTDLEWRAEIAGDGKLRGRLARLSARRGLAQRVSFLGQLEEMASFYARQDVIAVPSRYEGFCYVAAEAALAGLPVLASDVSSLREIVVDGQTGLLVPPESPQALASALSKLAAAPATREELGCRAIELAADRFRPAALHDELAAFLARCVALGPLN